MNFLDRGKWKSSAIKRSANRNKVTALQLLESAPVGLAVAAGQHF
jgi:hypothetical protein